MICEFSWLREIDSIDERWRRKSIFIVPMCHFLPLMTHTDERCTWNPVDNDFWHRINWINQNGIALFYWYLLSVNEPSDIRWLMWVDVRVRSLQSDDIRLKTFHGFCHLQSKQKSHPTSVMNMSRQPHLFTIYHCRSTFLMPFFSFFILWI